MAKETTYTRTPNFVFSIMHTLTPAEFKVIMVIVRKTHGFHKDRDAISLTQFMEMTGLSRQGVVNALDSLVKNGHVLKHPMGNTTNYSVRIVNSVDYDQSTELTTCVNNSQLSLPEVVNSVDYLVNSVDQQVVNSVDSQKKHLKETMTKENKNNDHVLGIFLRSIVEGAGFVYMDRNFNQIAARLESDYSTEQLLRAVEQTKEAHQKKIDKGERGITAPLAYMATLLSGAQNGKPPPAVTARPRFVNGKEQPPEGFRIVHVEGLPT